MRIDPTPYVAVVFSAQIACESRTVVYGVRGEVVVRAVVSMYMRAFVILCTIQADLNSLVGLK